MCYNSKYYFDGKLHQLRPKKEAEHTFILSDGTIIAMFQGSRGQNPQLDFQIKLLRKGITETPEAPPHIYWVVDLMIKKQEYPDEVKEILDYFIKFYDDCQPFRTVDERVKYSPTTLEHIMKKYSHVHVESTLPIDYIALILELFCLCEKQNDGAYMFRDLLLLLKDYVDGKADYMNVLYNAKPLHR